MRAIIVLLLLYCCVQDVAAQQVKWSCGQEEVMNRAFEQVPGLRTRHEQIESEIYARSKTSQQRGNEEVITLPVVIHVIHNNGPENLSDTRILAGLQHLNEAFANIGYYDPTTGVDTKIQFCLAARSPGGGATTGINRVVSPLTSSNGFYNWTTDLELKNLSRWDSRCYINIWIVAEIQGSVAAYASMPASHGTAGDGIVIESYLFGASNFSDAVITHEMGHYLGLYHTFNNGCANNDCTIDGDKVCDTPPDNSAGNLLVLGCNVTMNTCSTDVLSGFSSDQNDQIENYMDYGNLTCMTIFTQGQKDRMRWHIENVRSSLLNCRSCLPPCSGATIAAFSSSATDIMAGTTVNFTNSSFNASGYQWYINDVLQASSVNFSFLFDTEGIFIVKLVARPVDPVLCADVVKTVTIRVTCPVRADFLESAVEVEPGTTVSFTNHSTGATSYQWYVNDVLIGSSLHTSFHFAAPGRYIVKLVAGNGVCISVKEIYISVSTACTSFYFDKMFSSDNYHSLAADIDQLPDSSYIGCARVTDYTPGNTGSKGLVIKYSKKGAVAWAKFLKGGYVYDQKILHDGSVVYIGGSRLPDGRSGIFIAKLSTDGTVLWQRRYISAETSLNTVELQRTRIDETPDHSLVFTCQLTNNGLSPKRALVGKLTADGDIVWIKQMENASKLLNPKSILADHNAIYWFLDNTDAAVIVKLDAASGSIIYKKQYVLNSPGNALMQFTEEKINGNIIQIYAANPSQDLFDSIKHMYLHVDTLGVFQKGTRIKLITPMTTVYPGFGFDNHAAFCANGDMLFTEAAAIGSNFWLQQISVYRGDINGNLVYSKLLSYSTDSKRIYQIKEGVDGNTILFGSRAVTSRSRLFLYNSDASGEIGGSCTTTTLPFVKYPVSITTSEYNYTTYNDYTLTPDAGFSPPIEDAIFSTSVLCASESTPCYKVKIEGVDSICTQTDSITYKATRNADCTDRVQWSISPGTYESRVLSDSSVKIRFLQPGIYKLTGALSSCAEVDDTLRIVVSRNANTLALGEDIRLCDMSAYTIKAGAGFKSYKWQDGSEDSLLTAYYPGIYYVTVTDYCNNSKTDTLIISQASAVPFDLGADISYCKNDTAVITAPPGFAEYTWASPYNINSTSGRVVKVWPSVDTLYTVTAKFGEGCIVFDSIRVKILTAPSIALGNDTSFCAGGSVVLDAGTGFINYSWNTGSVSSTITADHAGAYTVAATAPNGCVSRDTFVVEDVFIPAVIDLGDDTNLCGTAPLLLDAGPGFVSYLWNTGATASRISVGTVGSYWVKITDAHNCISSDTIVVASVFPHPSGFLPKDTILCSPQPLLLHAAENYNRYLWSTGSTLSFVEITIPGSYWLEVTAANGCTAKEYVEVREETCKTGIYFPGIFSPNHDGLNDVFKPSVFGKLKKYRLTIYNRWGQKIFEASNPVLGWDGKLQSMDQPSDNYVWFVSYQFENEPAKTSKGNIILMR